MRPQASRRAAILAASGLLMVSLSACLGGDERGGLAAAIVPSVDFPSTPLAPAPTAAEADYIDGTVRALFRTRAAERTAGFVRTGAEGYGVCARSVNNGGYDYALIVLQRRILSGAISQVEDDALILRGAEETLACRTDVPDDDWVPTD